MTEKTTLQQIQTLAYSAINADNDQEQFSKLMEIIKLTESDHQPPFAVGEYRAYKDHIYKITEDHETYICCAELVDGVLISHSGSYKSGGFYHGSSPATAEQIAEFKRAEQFASKGRKLDEFRVGDKVMIDNAKIGTIFQIKNGTIDAKISGFRLPIICLEPDGLTLIQTAEELQEVDDGEDRKN